MEQNKMNETSAGKAGVQKKKRHPLFYPAIILVLLIAGFILSNYLNEQQKLREAQSFRNANYAPQVSEDNELLVRFLADFPSCREVLRACEEDVTDDGRKDLVLVYRTQDKLTRMIVCQNNADGVVYSEPIPGPVENQQIQFKNIDKTGPIEFIVSGEKKGAVGYAIYRMIDGEPVDLFGEGMADCC
ncbi:MAG: Cys-Cys-COOH (seleno)protein SaoC [Eubacteriales bacterium]|nr:Cys-Cys-COOH (seleno)protein SaoC [Eubacteriales bacterium]